MSLRPVSPCIGFIVLAALSLTSPALAVQGTPISQTGTVLQDEPPGNGFIARATTGADGSVIFRNLKPGKYVFVVDGPDLIRAMDRLAPPPAPEKKSSSSFSLGLGGFLGGGGGSSRAAPNSPGVGAAPGVGGTRSSSSGGSGMSFGTNIPLGGGGDTRRESNSGGIETVVVTAQFLSGAGGEARQALDANTANWGNGTGMVSFETPYCRDVAGAGIRIHFTVPQGGGAARINVWQLMQGQNK